MKSDDDDLSPEDKALFRESVKDVTPLDKTRESADQLEKPVEKHLQSAPSAQGKTTVKIKIRKESLLEFPLSDFSQELVEGDSILECTGKGISHKDMRRLKSGAFNIDSALDLHCLTTEEARQQLLAFLERAQERGWHCVRIVHGKGKHGHDKPILKNLVNTWLRQLPPVIAFCSAQPRDGGTGAVYVLLVRD